MQGRIGPKFATDLPFGFAASELKTNELKREKWQEKDQVMQQIFILTKKVFLIRRNAVTYVFLNLVEKDKLSDNSCDPKTLIDLKSAAAASVSH